MCITWLRKLSDIRRMKELGNNVNLVGLFQKFEKQTGSAILYKGNASKSLLCEARITTSLSESEDTADNYFILIYF